MTFDSRVIAILGAVVLGDACAASAAEPANPDAAARVYSAPREVFRVYRDALAVQDWRAFFHCHTPDARTDLVFEAYFACNMHDGNAEVLRLLEKHHVSTSVVDEKHFRAFRDKHGIDLRTLVAEREKRFREAILAKKVPQPPGTPLPPTDTALLRDIVLAQIVDKAGFFAGAHKLVTSPDSLPRIGELSEVKIEDDAAIGRASVTTFHYSTAAGGPTKIVPTVSHTSIHFRRVGGSWLKEGPVE